MDFQERLRMAIARKNYKLDDLAEKTGIAVGTIGNWKKGKTDPSFFCLMCLAEVLEVSLDWLAWGEKYGKVQM